MPMERERYPEDWERIAREVKEEAGWRCEECGKQCRRPGEPFDTHRRTLTVSHVNHDPADCRRENLRALCAPCHLRYDAAHHAETRRKRRLAERMKVTAETCRMCRFFVVDEDQGTVCGKSRTPVDEDAEACPRYTEASE